ncbi:MAG: hypothetical protein H6767_04565 [Candidatus Peribacteria bacterium]|nr:MAG: hypothetical protein H6767_04565 [Candidatus Peribacteria bacterium]
MKDWKLLISSLLIVLAFFIGYYFAATKYEIEIQKLQNERFSVEIETSKDEISITKSSEKIDVMVDGERK